MAEINISENPNPPPDWDSLLLWLGNIVPQIVNAIYLLQDGVIKELHSAPAKPYTGMLVLADGTDWNPGSGRGVYVYDEGISAWRFLG